MIETWKHKVIRESLEKSLFERLIKINGVGAKVAIAILSTYTPQAFAKVVEESEELKSADDAHRQEEAGDLLFAVVNVLRFYKIDPEMALHEANRKFFRRFCAVENEIRASGREMKDCTLDEMDAIWNAVKEREKQN